MSKKTERPKEIRIIKKIMTSSYLTYIVRETTYRRWGNVGFDKDEEESIISHLIDHINDELEQAYELGRKDANS